MGDHIFCQKTHAKLFSKMICAQVQFHQSCMVVPVRQVFTKDLLFCKTSRHHGDIDVEDVVDSCVHRKQLETGID